MVSGLVKNIVAVDPNFSSGKREYFRVKLNRIQARYCFLNSSSTHATKTCYLNDISLGGLNITANESFIVGDELQVTFPVDEDVQKESVAHLTVMYTNSKTAGCKFSIIHKKTELEIEQMVNEKIFR